MQGAGIVISCLDITDDPDVKKYKIHFNPASTDLYKGCPNSFHWYWDLTLLNDLLHAEHYMHLFFRFEKQLITPYKISHKH